jgi:hypothetical protein
LITLGSGIHQSARFFIVFIGGAAVSHDVS